MPEAYPETSMYQQTPVGQEEPKLPTDIVREPKLPEPEAERAGELEEDEEDVPDEWKGKDYTNRCLCGMSHNDDFMVECDRCK